MKKFNHFENKKFIGTPEECDWYLKNLKDAQDKRARDMNCIGSACMMWRVDSYARFMVRYDHLPEEVRPLEVVQRGGYCGLAGKL
jgi:hypothetical protein